MPFITVLLGYRCVLIDYTMCGWGCNMIHCFLGMQEANLGVCSSSSWYTEESLCGFNRLLTSLLCGCAVEVFLPFLGNKVPYRAVAPYGCTEGVHPSLPNAKGHL